AWAAACQWLRDHPATEFCRPGLSPHAPYSVRGSLFRAGANLARQQQLPLAIHLAETRAELELLRQHGGPFKHFLSELGVWDEAALVTVRQEVCGQTRGVADSLFIHGIPPAPATVPANATVVYCPRTHAEFGHEPHPFRALMDAGVRIALATDSLASNP